MQTVRFNINSAAETADIDGQGLTRQSAVADDSVQYLQASKYSLTVRTLHGHQANVAAKCRVRFTSQLLDKRQLDNCS